MYCMNIIFAVILRVLLGRLNKKFAEEEGEFCTFYIDHDTSHTAAVRVEERSVTIASHSDVRSLTMAIQLLSVSN